MAEAEPIQDAGRMEAMREGHLRQLLSRLEILQAHSAPAFPGVACHRLLQLGHGLARRGDSAEPTVPVRILLHYSIHGNGSGSATALTLKNMIANLINKLLQEVGVQFYAPPTNVRPQALANDLMSFFLR
uniref:Uncharacterized protein n=1 Tax=Oryza glumipatula TaxID=40148 RepID=A0A0E0BF69_9ORYZ